MSVIDPSWEQRVADAWTSIDAVEPGVFRARIDRLAAELPPQSSAALFERASAADSTGHPDLAVPLYRSALAAGLKGTRRRRATIQLASSLRNLGKPAEAASLLAEETRAAPDELDGAVRAFLALALATWAASARRCPKASRRSPDIFRATAGRLRAMQPT